MRKIFVLFSSLFLSFVISFADSWEIGNDRINGGFRMRHEYRIDYKDGLPDYNNKVLFDTTYYDEYGNLIKKYSPVEATLFTYKYDSSGALIYGEHYESINETGDEYQSKYIFHYTPRYVGSELVGYLEEKEVYNFMDSLIEYDKEEIDTLKQGDTIIISYYSGRRDLARQEISSYDSDGRIQEFTEIGQYGAIEMRKKYKYDLEKGSYRVDIFYPSDLQPSYQIFDSRNNLIEEKIFKSRFYSIRKMKYQKKDKRYLNYSAMWFSINNLFGKYTVLQTKEPDTNDIKIEESEYSRDGKFKFTKYYDYENGCFLGMQVIMDNGKKYKLYEIYTDSAGCYIKNSYAIDNYEKYFSGEEKFDFENRIWTLKKFDNTGFLKLYQYEQYDEKNRIIRDCLSKSSGLNYCSTTSYNDIDNSQIIDHGDNYKTIINFDEFGNIKQQIFIDEYSGKPDTTMTLYEYFK